MPKATFFNFLASSALQHQASRGQGLFASLAKLAQQGLLVALPALPDLSLAQQLAQKVLQDLSVAQQDLAQALAARLAPRDLGQGLAALLAPELARQMDLEDLEQVLQLQHQLSSALGAQARRVSGYS